MSELLLPSVNILILVCLNGLFVAAEFAILAAPRPLMEKLAAEGNRLARLVFNVQSDARRQDAYIATAQLGITAASLGLGMYGEANLARWLDPRFEALGMFSKAAAHVVASVTAIGVLTYLHIVLGEMVPKSLALAFSAKTAMAVSIPMQWIHNLAFGLVWLLNSTGNLILRIIRVPIVTESGQAHTPEELELIVEESQETGFLGEEEGDIFVNILHFRDLQVRKVMVPRTRVEGLRVNTSVAEAVRQVSKSRHTRYPVYEEDLDHIVGMLHVKELFRAYQQTPEAPDLRGCLRPPLYVPEQLTVEQLLVEFQQHGAQIAVSIDEYGGTAGIVSLEDVLEEIFGEVQDEFDEEEPRIQAVSPDTFRVQGMVRLDELEEETGLELVREDVDTIGGLLMAELGRPPMVNDSLLLQGCQMLVLEMDGLAVKWLQVQRLNLPDTEDNPPLPPE